MRVADAGEALAGQSLPAGGCSCQVHQHLGGPRGGFRELPRPGQDQGAGGPPGGAPGLLGSVTGIALVQAPDRRLLRVLSLVKDGLDLAAIPHAAIPHRVHGIRASPTLGLTPTASTTPPTAPPRDTPRMARGWPKQPLQAPYWSGVVGQWTAKRPSWAILGVFAGPAPRAGPRPAPSFPGGSGVCWRVPSFLRAYPSLPHGSPPFYVFVPYMYRAESVYIQNMARVVIIFCLNTWNGGRGASHHSEQTVGFHEGVTLEKSRTNWSMNV